MTVDNIAAEEGGGLGFVSGEPFSEATNEAFKASVMGLIDSVDTMMLGAAGDAQRAEAKAALMTARARAQWRYSREPAVPGEWSPS